jgi:hypothetical protein
MHARVSRVHMPIPCPCGSHTVARWSLSKSSYTPENVRYGVPWDRMVGLAWARRSHTSGSRIAPGARAGCRGAGLRRLTWLQEARDACGGRLDGSRRRSARPCGGRGATPLGTSVARFGACDSSGRYDLVRLACDSWPRTCFERERAASARVQCVRNPHCTRPKMESWCLYEPLAAGCWPCNSTVEAISSHPPTAMAAVRSSPSAPCVHQSLHRMRRESVRVAYARVRAAISKAARCGRDFVDIS